jgi:hypothetical protein
LRTVLKDSDKRRAQFERLELVDTGRRWRWSEDEKVKIVLESLQAPRGDTGDIDYWQCRVDRSGAPGNIPSSYSVCA